MKTVTFMDKFVDINMFHFFLQRLFARFYALTHT